MRYCPKCGAQTNGAFCASCGSRVDEPAGDLSASTPQNEAPPAYPSAPPHEPPATSYAPPPSYPSPSPQPPPPTPPPPPYPPVVGAPPGYAPPPPPSNPYGSSAHPPILGGGPFLPPAEASRLIRSVGSSPLFLVATILFSTSFLIDMYQRFSMILQYGAYYNPLGMYGNLFYSMGLDDMYSDIYSAMRDVSAVTTIFSLLFLVFPLLIVIGLWLFFGASMRKGSDAFPTTTSTSGLTLIKTSVMIQNIFLLVLLGVIWVVSLIGLIASGTMLSSYGDAGVATAVFIGLLFALSAAFVLLIIYMIGIVKTANTAVSAFRGLPSGNHVSMFVVVFNFIAAFFTFGSTIYSAAANPYYSIPSILQGLSSAVVMALISIGMIIARSKLAARIPR